ncbi:MAG: type II toxin-antitoxin system PemK/MazF family toxin [Ignavibacteriaceae bacterium]|nr:type II toxin-antitoxin system PemK/MazF family toxin [Ignavibacteriaceae bacterium]
MKEGDVVLTILPQADGKSKLRPVLLLRELPPPYNDFLVCGISTQLHQMIKGFDELISTPDDDFKISGLIQESIIRLNFLAVIPLNLIAGSIGRISEIRHQKILQRLSDYLLKK